MTYLNIKTAEGVETIDAFETYKEAKEMRREYIIASNFYSGIYLSQRSTKAWRS